VTRWQRAFPQYRPHHHDLVAAIADSLPRTIALAGASYHGIGIPACIRSGARLRTRRTALRPREDEHDDPRAELLGALLVAALATAACGDDDERRHDRRGRDDQVAPTATASRPAATDAPPRLARRDDDHDRRADHDPPRRPRRRAGDHHDRARHATTAPTTFPRRPCATPAPPAAGPAGAVVTCARCPQPIAPRRRGERAARPGRHDRDPEDRVSKTRARGDLAQHARQGPGPLARDRDAGQPGNVVVAGTDEQGPPFRHIDQLVAGDEVIFTTRTGGSCTSSPGPDRPPGRDVDRRQTPASTATLFACHPGGSTRERIVVFLQLQA
jgi:hypothetical protein